MTRALNQSLVFCLISAVAPCLSAAPNISSVSNAASNISPGLPNAPIAQGAIFVVYGSGLGPANIAFASTAFQSTTVSGTSVSITISGTTVAAPLYYTSAGQVAALLPSNTLTGTGTITVTYNNQPSNSAPITVVTRNLGIFTVDSSGGGPGIVTYADYSLVSPTKAANCGGPNTTCGAANPGDTLILWATGLGPVNGSDASGTGLGQNMPNVPLTVWLGGVQATVSYQGRSGCCVGEDQIVFTVPANVPTGCAVPLLVQIGTTISNNTLMPVANNSRTCPLVTAQLAPLDAVQIEQAITAGPATYGSISLAHFSDGGGSYEDDAKLQFLKLTGYTPGTQPFFASSADDQPLGTCIVYNNANASFNNPITAASQLDAGSTYTLTGPKGSQMLTVGNGRHNPFNMTGAFLVPGTYTIIGPGGADVGPVSGTITIPPAATMVSPVNNSSVTRSSGMTITWTGGSGNLQIQVVSCVDGACNTGAAAVCTFSASAGSFAIPPYILEGLPAGPFAGVVLSSISEGTFTASGLQAASLVAYSNLSGFGYGWGSGAFALK